MPQLKVVDRIVPDPRSVQRKGDGDAEVLCGPNGARAQFTKTIRIACRGRPATTEANVHPMDKFKMNVRMRTLTLLVLIQYPLRSLETAKCGFHRNGLVI